MSDKTLLTTKYPKLFDSDTSKQLIYVPVKWHLIVDSMCGVINQHILGPTPLEVIPKLKFRYKLYCKYWVKIRNKVHNIFDPERKYYTKYSNQLCISPIFEQYRITNTLNYKLCKWFDSAAFKFFNGYIFFQNVSKPTKFKITLISQRHDSLLILYKNADDYIRGVVELSKHMSRSVDTSNEL